MNPLFRLSRLRYPRSNLATYLLVAVVFITFGLVASTVAPTEGVPAAHYVDGPALALTNWLVGQL